MRTWIRAQNVAEWAGVRVLTLNERRVGTLLRPRGYTNIVGFADSLPRGHDEAVPTLRD
jgi:hypothetical protein